MQLDTLVAPAPPRRRGLMRVARTEPSKGVLLVVLFALSAIMAYPFIYMVVKSFVVSGTRGSASAITLESWRDLFATSDLLRQLANSAIVTVGALVLILLFSSAAGYAFGKLPFRGGGFAFYLLVGCMMIPAVSVVIPLYVNMAKVHLIGNYFSAILAYAAFGIPFGTFLMTAFFRSLPNDLIDAALCDGVGYVGSFFRIALPMARPALASVGVLQFILIWNDLLIGLLFLPTPQVRTITVGIGVLSSGNLTSLSLLMAGSVLSAVPVLAVYALFQRYLIAGLTVGVSR